MIAFHKFAENILLALGLEPKSRWAWCIYIPLIFFICFSLEAGFEYFKLQTVQFNVNSTAVNVDDPLFFLESPLVDAHIDRIVLTLNYEDNKIATAEIKDNWGNKGIHDKHYPIEYLPILQHKTQNATHLGSGTLKKLQEMYSSKDIAGMAIFRSIPYPLSLEKSFRFNIPEPSQLNCVKLKTTFAMKLWLFIPVFIDRDFQTSLEPTGTSSSNIKRYCTWIKNYVN